MLLLTIKDLFIFENSILGLLILIIILLYRYVNKKEKRFSIKAENLKEMILADVDIDIVKTEIEELYKLTYDNKSIKYVEKLQRKIDLTYHV